MNRYLIVRVLCALWLISGMTITMGADVLFRNIGIEGDVSVMLDRDDYQPRLLDDRTPLVLRVERITPLGDGRFTYDFHYMGFEPGSYLLADYLMLADGSVPGDIGGEVLEVQAILPADHDGALNPYVTRPFPWFGGYRMVLGMLGFLWVLGWVAFIYFGRNRRVAIVPVVVPPPPSFAELILPYIEQAAEGHLSATGKAELERLLSGFWRERLSLREHRMTESLAELKRHGEAGALLRALERWLHCPSGASREEINELLNPYRAPLANTKLGEVSV